MIEMMTRELSWKDLACIVGASLFGACAVWAGIPPIPTLGMTAGVVLLVLGFSKR